MKKRIITALITAMCVSASLTGCNSSDTKDNASVQENVAVSKEAQVDTDVPAEIIEEQVDTDVPDEPVSESVTEEASGTSFTASQDILNADLASGKVQICDDVFQNGGYITVNDFVAQYGDHWDCSIFDPSADVPADEFAKELKSTTPDFDGCLQINCFKSASGSNTIGDAVIVRFNARTEETFDNTWFPTGLKQIDEYTLDSIVSLYGSNGFTPTDYCEELLTKSNPTENVGKYVALNAEEYNALHNNYVNMEIFSTVIELPETNLFGIKPVVQLYHTFSDKEDGTGRKSILSYNNIYVKDNTIFSR